MLTVSDFFGVDAFEDLQSRVLIEDEIPVVEFWKNKQLVAVRAFPDNTLEYAENAAENFVMGILKL